jgi:hypothetical protein
VAHPSLLSGASLLRSLSLGLLVGDVMKQSASDSGSLLLGDIMKKT